MKIKAPFHISKRAYQRRDAWDIQFYLWAWQASTLRLHAKFWIGGNTPFMGVTDIQRSMPPRVQYDS